MISPGRGKVQHKSKRKGCLSKQLGQHLEGDAEELLVISRDSLFLKCYCFTVHLLYILVHLS